MRGKSLLSATWPSLTSRSSPCPYPHPEPHPQPPPVEHSSHFGSYPGKTFPVSLSSLIKTPCFSLFRPLLFGPTSSHLPSLYSYYQLPLQRGPTLAVLGTHPALLSSVLFPQTSPGLGNYRPATFSLCSTFRPRLPTLLILHAFLCTPSHPIPPLTSQPSCSIPSVDSGLAETGG